MFTGIIEGMGTIESIEGGVMEISPPWPVSEFRIGQSLAVDGCCLTVVKAQDHRLAFDLSPETFDRTTFGDRAVGDAVNLERGLKFGDALDGHLVSGHIDTKGSIRSITDLPEGNREYWINVPQDRMHWLAEKGSVSINGISLTVCDMDDQGFSLFIIPHTLKVTTLGGQKVGDSVNVEFDLMAKYIERFLEKHPKFN